MEPEFLMQNLVEHFQNIVVGGGEPRDIDRVNLVIVIELSLPHFFVALWEDVVGIIFEAAVELLDHIGFLEVDFFGVLK